ncbi:MAG: NAD-dependent succinate-semialdehyde dehydrogenase [Phormidesmis sp. CAN_BIN36]|nr:NAD-dependent succinate-semialdehyde dehydrogenase [Phormidesmis sp. CAN_BIN36]
MGISTTNPANGEVLKTFESLSDRDLEAKLDYAQQTFLDYRTVPMSQKAIWLNRAAEILETERDRFGKIMTLEMGKPLKAAIAEVEKCVMVCRYYAENAPQLLADVAVETDATHSFIRYQPLGVILAVMPWNFPFWQVFRFAAPALMAGNVGLLKHASNVPQCALAIEEVLHRAGFPTGAFQTLLIGSDKVAAIVADDRVKAATLTGSELAGSSLAATAGKHLKKVVLELGGSDPFIVMPSADLETAISTAVTARMINNGQSCIAAKRFILADAIADEFIDRLVAKYRALKIGDPLLPDTDIGPLATPGILKDLDQQVKTSVQQGAKVLMGGEPLSDRPGNFYPPTILSEIPAGCLAEHEEFFGPVALLFRVPDIDAAIQRANDSPFGLGASAWTTDPQERDRFIEEIESGSVFINSMVKSDVRLPFGGIKRSGYGRELGKEGIHEFVNIKTVWEK